MDLIDVQYFYILLKMMISKIWMFISLIIIYTLADGMNSHKAKTKLIPSRTHSLVGRLHPGQDIMQTLTQLLTQHPHKAVTISTAVGSVRYCYIRFANQSYLSKVDGPLEVTSITGTFDKNLNPHIHIAVANTAGIAFGGHLPSLKQRSSKQDNTVPIPYDCPIFTTLEVSLNIHENVVFDRKVDPETTYDELTISKSPRYFPYPFFKNDQQNEQV